jgi:hypothetical protein
MSSRRKILWGNLGILGVLLVVAMAAYVVMKGSIGAQVYAKTLREGPPSERLKAATELCSRFCGNRTLTNTSACSSKTNSSISHHDRREVQAVVESPAFLSDARLLRLTGSERLGIVAWIADNLAAGDVIEERAALGTDIPVFLLNIFAKNEKTDLTPKERRVLKNVLADISKTYRSRRESR